MNKDNLLDDVKKVLEFNAGDKKCISSRELFSISNNQNIPKDSK